MNIYDVVTLRNLLILELNNIVGIIDYFEPCSIRSSDININPKYVQTSANYFYDVREEILVGRVDSNLYYFGDALYLDKYEVMPPEQMLDYVRSRIPKIGGRL